jgi:hypothetical protein
VFTSKYVAHKTSNNTAISENQSIFNLRNGVNQAKCLSRGTWVEHVPAFQSNTTLNFIEVYDNLPFQTSVQNVRIVLLTSSVSMILQHWPTEVIVWWGLTLNVSIAEGTAQDSQ